MIIRSRGTMTIINILHFLLKSFLFTSLALVLCKNIIPETKMVIHLLFIPLSLAPQSSIRVTFISIDYNTSNILGPISLQRDYWVIYYPPTFHGNETPGKLFCILFSSSFQTRLLAPTWDLRLVKFPPHYSQLCALSQVSKDLKGNGCLN